MRTTVGAFNITHKQRIAKCVDASCAVIVGGSGLGISSVSMRRGKWLEFELYRKHFDGCDRLTVMTSRLCMPPSNSIDRSSVKNGIATAAGDFHFCNASHFVD